MKIKFLILLFIVRLYAGGFLIGTWRNVHYIVAGGVSEAGPVLNFWYDSKPNARMMKVTICGTWVIEEQ